MTTEQKLQATIDFLMDEIRWRDNGNAAMTFRQRLAYQCYYEKNGNFLFERSSPKVCWVPDSWEPPTYSRIDIEEEDTDEEEEEEELDICGITGREFDQANPRMGCGVAIKEDDENIMIGNISFCEVCAEREIEEDEDDEEETIICRRCKKECDLEDCEHDHCDECFNDKFEKWLEDNGYEDGRWVNNEDRTDNHKIEEDFYLVLESVPNNQ